MKVKTIIEVCHELNAEEIEKFNALTKEEREEFYKMNKNYISELILSEFPRGSRVLNISFEIE
jgi:hypothetical protein